MPHKPKATTAKAAAKVREQKESRKARHLPASSLQDGSIRKTKTIPPSSLLREKALIKATEASGSVFQVQGQYLHIKMVFYFDYKSDGAQNLVKQIIIDPQDTFPIFGSTGQTVIGTEPVDIQVHVLQPNTVTAPDGSITTAATKPVLVASSIPLQYATGVGGTGFRQFGWGKTTTQVNPSNEPSWVPVFNFENTELPRGAVWDVSDTQSNLCVGAFWVLDPDDFAQANCLLQFRAQVEVRIPLPNVNVAKWKVTDNVGSEYLDEIGKELPISYTAALTEIQTVKKDPRGRLANEIVDQMRMADARLAIQKWQEEPWEIPPEFA